MGQPQVLTIVLAAADDDGISVSQAVAVAGNLTITGALATGGVATITSVGAARQVIITSGGNDTGVTFTIYGLDAGYSPQTDAVTGANAGIATSAKYFRTVTRIAASAAVATVVKAGTNGIGVTAWANLNIHAQPCNTSFRCLVTGTVNYTLQYTYDDLSSISDILSDAVILAVTASQEASYTYPITAGRVLLNSGTGTVKMTAIQAGITGN